MESEGYAVGAVDLCAASVGAPHIRQRMWWVADSDDRGPKRLEAIDGAQGALDKQHRDDADRCGLVCDGMANAGCVSDEFGMRLGETSRTPREDEAQEVQRERSRFDAWGGGSGGRMADPKDSGFPLPEPERWEARSQSDRGGFGMGRWIDCADGKTRRIEPSIEPLAHGISARVGRLRAYGNAIVPQVAAEVLKAWRF